MEDIKELAELLKKTQPQESALTIKWAAIITIIIATCGFLFIGYTTNSNRITRLEAQYVHSIEAISELKSSQLRMEELLNAIRYDQKRREAKEGRP